MNIATTRKLTIILTPHAYCHLEWLAHRSRCEISAMGLFEEKQKYPNGITIKDFILVKQKVSDTSVDLDMDWWADKQIDLYEQDGIEPWRTSCWCHTHPSGIHRPSKLDEETMRNSFGSWDFMVMLILTQDGVFYSRIDFSHVFDVIAALRFSAVCEVQVDWREQDWADVGPLAIKRWEEEYQDLVHEEKFELIRNNVTSHRKWGPSSPGNEEVYDAEINKSGKWDIEGIGETGNWFGYEDDFFTQEFPDE